jgi:hypothetical protein
MNIFYWAHFAGYDGYGQTARAYVELLIELGYNVTCRCIDNPQWAQTWGEKWQELCSAPMEKRYDIAIVHKSPFWQRGAYETVHDREPFNHANKIFWYTVFETSRWPDCWREPLSYFDKVLTPSNWQVNAAKSIMTDYDGKVELLPHRVQSLFERKPAEGIYTFYSELSRASMRKGTDILLKAYFKEFSKDDNCRLLLKAPIAQMQSFDKIFEEISQTFRWKKDNLPRVDVCSSFLTDEQLELLMNQAHCYICSSRGEGFNIPLATAAIKGIPVLFPSHDDIDWGFDYIPRCIRPYNYNARVEDVLTNEFYTYSMFFSTEGMKWLEPDYRDLSDRMRNYYNNDNREDLDLKKIVYEKVGKPAILKRLQEVIES